MWCSVIITPKNWSGFQHYKDRHPAWIKLHRGLLDDFEFACLPVASRALAPLLWLLASEYEGGQIDTSLDKLAYRFRMTRGDVADALSPLIDAGFFSASEPLAGHKQGAIPEKEKEKEKEKNAVANATPKKSSDAELYDRGKEILGPNSGGLIKRLLAAKDNNIALARAAIEQASTKSNPREYLGAIIRSREAEEAGHSW